MTIRTLDKTGHTQKKITCILGQEYNLKNQQIKIESCKRIK